MPLDSAPDIHKSCVYAHLLDVDTRGALEYLNDGAVSCPGINIYSQHLVSISRIPLASRT